MEFSDTVRVLSTKTNSTQMQLAVKLGIHAAGVSARLSGRTRWTLDEVQLLAEYFGMSPADLLLGPAHALGQLARDKPVGKSSGQVPAIADATPSPKNEIG